MRGGMQNKIKEHTPVGLPKVFRIICKIYKFGMANFNLLKWPTKINDERKIDVDQVEYGVDCVRQKEEEHNAFQPLSIPAQSQASV